ncbi:hypothetical protein Fmac_025367 [Flemingia macrophylla]|uniref:Uncharacterized protein n=1 Tax=Flemingia macrophylla TaxID=520843 RepID=A0ABD1LS21_9FABA
MYVTPLYIFSIVLAFYCNSYILVLASSFVTGRKSSVCNFAKPLELETPAYLALDELTFKHIEQLELEFDLKTALWRLSTGWMPLFAGRTEWFEESLLHFGTTFGLGEEALRRVDIPPWFSAVSIALNSDVDLDLSKVERISESSLPIICFRDGSPPLPDALNTSLKESAVTGLNGLDVEQCFMEKNITMKLTNEQISPGAWYIGLFNGIGATRTQSKMEMVKKPLMENVMTCKSNIETFCVQEGVPELYSLEITNVAEELTIMAAILKLKNLLNILSFPA